MTQPSKLPWRADGSDMSLATWVYDANNKRVCTMARCETDWANAEFIAEAVNGHAALVERVAKLEGALQRLVRAFEVDYAQVPDMDIRTCFETNSQAIAQARAALAKP